MGSQTPKQFLTLGGLPVMVHALRVLEAADSVGEIILVVSEADREYCLREIVTRHQLSKVHKIVAGGERRQDSVRHGLAAIDGNPELVLVHDAVRPFLTREMIVGVLEQAAKHGAAVVGIPMRDTVKQVGADRVVEGTVDRRSLWLAQTPQAFRFELLREAHRRAELEGFDATDDAQLTEHLGHRVALVDGSAENIKITRPEDLAIGEAILAARGRRNA
jgi:2-C-methyl-D-erythritol 4-phosphate cytidylyltransferase